MRFDEVVEIALYHPSAGFYQRGGGAGRGSADFLTSPEVGPLFGAVLARALDSWWQGLGRPHPFVVVEAGAGAGTLAASVLAAAPACAEAGLRYVAVERSPALRAAAGVRLTGRAEVADRMPPGPWEGVVLANELLDNLPFRLLERSPDGWQEVRVDRHLREVLVPVEAPPALAEAGADLPVGARVPVQEQARRWVSDALASLSRGRVVAIDYGASTASLAARPWTEWVRTYRGHRRAGHPLEALGTADITCEVAFDQLPPPVSDRPQAEFLRAHGLDDLVAAARREWEARAHVGDLAAMRARSRLAEAAALTDPTGLGAFRAVEWEAPVRLDGHG